MLECGDRVRLYGGYDLHPTWLGEKPSVTGTVEAFIPGSVDTTEVVVRLDEPHSAGGRTGEILVLGLLFKDLDWEDRGIVKLELCDFEPDPAPRRERQKGARIEKGASYQKLDVDGRAKRPARRGRRGRQPRA